MRHKASITKVLVASLIALLVCASVGYSEGPQNPVAAVTSVTATVTSVQQPREKFVMKVDRPFFFAIRDNFTGVVLFMGSVTNPG